MPSTRAATLVICFDAGSRSESAEENGIAHFLEHLVFQGGESHPTVRDINWTGESLGARLNAYTSQDHVAFHITVRAERLPEAAELLTDFTARPAIDPELLERERGVVIQEIARSRDQPASHADDLLVKAVYGDHPLGRTVLGTDERLRSFGREEAVDFRRRCWKAERGGAFVAGNLSALASGELEGLLERFEDSAGLDAAEAAAPPAPGLSEPILVEQRDSEQSHLRLGYHPAIDMSDPDARAALELCVSLLGGSMGSRLIDEIREQRGLAYSVRATDYTAGDEALVLVSAGLQSDRCVEAAAAMKEIVSELAANGPSTEEVERARALLTGRRVLSFESTSAVAMQSAFESVVYGIEPDPEAIIARLDRVTEDQVAEAAASLAVEPALVCVGPHEAGEFT